MAGGLLDGITIIPAIMKEQNCDWDEAAALWKLSMEVEAEQHDEPGADIIPFPIERVRR